MKLNYLLNKHLFNSLILCLIQTTTIFGADNEEFKKPLPRSPRSRRPMLPPTKCVIKQEKTAPQLAITKALNSPAFTHKQISQVAKLSKGKQNAYFVKKILPKYKKFIDNRSMKQDELEKLYFTIIEKEHAKNKTQEINDQLKKQQEAIKTCVESATSSTCTNPDLNP